MYTEKKTLSFTRTNGTKITFSINLDWLKDQFNVLDEEKIDEKIAKSQKPTISEIYARATENKKESDFQFIESIQKSTKSDLKHTELGEAISLGWEATEKLFREWCKANKLSYCNIERSETEITLAVYNENPSMGLAKKLKKIAVKYDPEKENEDWDEAYEPNYWPYNGSTGPIYIGETLTGKILFALLKEKLKRTYSSLYALYDMIIITEK